ncbi:hypothetical protein [Flavivirga eckloniae]|uniref:Lipoprotein n=1 Tax=Flavivirga eckloniae TaxID=1803846 RepID=A0A2K9PRZ6_9FLAO|nr:hypothetical protein [Flavivirga eckloniae]AUP79809.1 hypothetical protein C1H87_14285 [Flavivirga eckloniae]
MVRLFLIFLIAGSLMSCGVSTEHLKEGIKKIPVDKNYFARKFRNKYNVKIPNEVDSKSVYREVFLIENGKKYESNKLRDFSLLRFYENGCVNKFIITKSQDLERIDLNPDDRGYRGVVYTKKDKCLVSFFVPVSETYRYGLQKKIISVEGDTLFMKYKNEDFITVYVKDSISNKNLKYIANW